MNFEPQPDGYTEQLIRQSTQAVNQLYQRERRKLCKKAKARVRNTLALLKTQLTDLN